MKNKGWTLIELMILILMVTIISGFIALVCFGIKGCNTVREKGIKNVANELWDGKKPMTNYVSVTNNP